MKLFLFIFIFILFLAISIFLTIYMYINKYTDDVFGTLNQANLENTKISCYENDDSVDIKVNSYGEYVVVKKNTNIRMPPCNQKNDSNNDKSKKDDKGFFDFFKSQGFLKYGLGSILILTYVMDLNDLVKANRKRIVVDEVETKIKAQDLDSIEAKGKMEIEDPEMKKKFETDMESLKSKKAKVELEIKNNLGDTDALKKALDDFDLELKKVKADHPGVKALDDIEVPDDLRKMDEASKADGYAKKAYKKMKAGGEVVGKKLSKGVDVMTSRVKQGTAKLKNVLNDVVPGAKNIQESVEALAKSRKSLQAGAKIVSDKVGKVAQAMSSPIIDLSKKGAKIGSALADAGKWVGTNGMGVLKAASRKVSDLSTKIGSKISQKTGLRLADEAGGLTKLGKGTKFMKSLGVIGAFGGFAACMAMSSEDDESSEEKAACGVELLLDLALEALEMFGKKAFGMIASGVGAFLLVFMISVAILDMIDLCQFERYKFDNKMLRSLKDTLDFEIWKTITVEISKSLYFMIEAQKEQYNEAFVQYLEKIGKDEHEYLTDMLKDAIDAYKYPKPKEFELIDKKGDLDRLTLNDLIIFNSFRNEYYTANKIIFPDENNQAQLKRQYEQAKVFKRQIATQYNSLSRKYQELSLEVAMFFARKKAQREERLSRFLNLINTMYDSRFIQLKELNIIKLQNEKKKFNERLEVLQNSKDQDETTQLRIKMLKSAREHNSRLLDYYSNDFENGNSPLPGVGYTSITFKQIEEEIKTNQFKIFNKNGEIDDELAIIEENTLIFPKQDSKLLNNVIMVATVLTVLFFSFMIILKKKNKL